MGLALFLLFAILELVLVIWTCRKERKRSNWRRNRVISRAVQTVIAMLAILLPFGQKWRLVPALVFFIVLLLAAVFVMLLKRNRDDGEKTVSGAVASCILSILFTGIVLVPAFIFTGYKGLPVTGEYKVLHAASILINESETDPFETDGSFREVPVHFYYPEALENEENCFPLVIFLHGAFGYYQSNVSTYMELASHGYVVVSLDHPHHAFFTRDSDGNLVTVDPEYIQSAIRVSNDEMDGEEQYELEAEWMKLRTSDLNFVMDQIKAAKDKEDFTTAWTFPDSGEREVRAAIALIDIENTGLMGHSMGGATSTELGRERDDIDAVVCIDGTMLGEYMGYEDHNYIISDEPYTVPLLDFSNESHHRLREESRAQGLAYPNNVVADNAPEGIYTEVWIKGTEHMDFTDLPLLSPFLGNMLGSGERDKEETMTIVNSLILDFYDYNLKGKGEFTAKDSY